MNSLGEAVSVPLHKGVIIVVLMKIPKNATYPTLMESCICGCGGGACIQQREYERQRTDPLSPQELQEMILFRVNGKCGYPLGDALKRQFTGLDGKDEKMFVGYKSSISIRLEVCPAA